MVSGVSIEAFWTATYLWDLANYLIPSVAIVMLFAAFNLPYYTGANLPAVGTSNDYVWRVYHSMMFSS